ncbi:MAG: hypothetical protein ACEY3D_03750 [Rickettsia sp.]|uniref:hypothetical protein n=1 Tax=Rickettsia sp. TaxID=789 RepID=UPI003977F4AE
MKLESFIHKLNKTYLKLYQNITTAVKDIYIYLIFLQNQPFKKQTRVQRAGDSIPSKMNLVKNDETLQGKLMRVEEHTLQKTTLDFFRN